MSEEDIRKVFANNLRRILEMSGKQPVDIVNDLKIPFSTVSNWLSGAKFPRPAKQQLLADYLGVKVSDFTKAGDDIPESYYLNDEAKELAEFLFRNPNYKVLFDASRKIKPEDIDFVKAMLDRMAGESNDYSD
jgi:transcriptional regulator with XRE-family HTH domain